MIYYLVLAASSGLAFLGGFLLWRDPRRISPIVFIAGGGLLALLSLTAIYLTTANPLLMWVFALVMLVGLGLTLLGYPLLAGFLLWNGVLVLRKERRTLSNSLTLVLGLGMIALPFVLGFLNPESALDTFTLRGFIYFLLLGSISYVVACFAIFCLAVLTYRFYRGPRKQPKAVIVLGAGLLNGRVGPLLASRLDRAIALHAQYTGTGEDPLPFVPSGGQGPNEPRSEAEAMAEYACDQGVSRDCMLLETESTSTQENLEFSSRLLEITLGPDNGSKRAPVAVVTSGYHVFRTALLSRRQHILAQVYGAPTAHYYLPSAFVREFAAVMRMYLPVHAATCAFISLLSLLINA